MLTKTYRKAQYCTTPSNLKTPSGYAALKAYGDHHHPELSEPCHDQGRCAISGLHIRVLGRQKAVFNTGGGPYFTLR